jgi:hypothetical protein
MPSKYSSTALAALQERRLDGERQAERALAEALGAKRRAETRAAELEAAVGAARAGWQAARAGGGIAPTSAADAARQRRYWARLEAMVREAEAARQAHVTGALAAALRESEAARAAHLVARQRREVVDKAIARREAAARLDGQRRAEAELDDRARRPPENGRGG